MPAAWDTTLVSELRPGSPAQAFVEGEAAGGEPVAIAAVALFETAYGYARHADDARFRDLLAWLTSQAGDPATLTAVPFDAPAAIAAGRLRALQRMPFTPRKGDRRPKAERRVAWILDLQIAASCWAAGYDVATRSRADFERIANLLGKIAPGALPLVVEGAPF